MSDIFGIGGATQGLLNFGLNLGTSIYNGRMQQQAWKREDSAVRRRAKDMAAAGINPVMAAGSPAQSMAPMKIDAPEANVIGTMLEGAALKQADRTIKQTEEQTKLIREQIDSEISDRRIRALDASNRQQEELRKQGEYKFLGESHEWNRIEFQRSYSRYEEELKQFLRNANEEERRQAMHAIDIEAKRLGINVDTAEFQEWKRNMRSAHRVGLRTDVPRSLFGAQVEDFFHLMERSIKHLTGRDYPGSGSDADMRFGR